MVVGTIIVLPIFTAPVHWDRVFLKWRKVEAGNGRWLHENSQVCIFDRKHELKFPRKSGYEE
jgi:hypothetical protein